MPKKSQTNEEFKLSGDDIVKKVKELIKEGNDILFGQFLRDNYYIIQFINPTI